MPGFNRRIVRLSPLSATKGLPSVASPLNHLMRARRRKGHGIHSPYVYHLVSDVLFNKHPYYCFETLKNRYAGDKGNHRFGQILFKLASDARSTQALYIGCNGCPDLAYLAMVGTKLQVKAIALDENAFSLTQALSATIQTESLSVVPAFDQVDILRQLAEIPQLDLVVFRCIPDQAILNLMMEACLKKCHHKSVFVVNQPHDKTMAASWSQAKKNEAATAILESSQFGLILFRPDLEKKQYNL
jgi:hypothetical protein